MRRSLASVLSTYLRRGEAFTLQVVLQGKVKPIELAVYDVLEDGLDAEPLEDLGRGALKLYPFATMYSIEVVPRL